MPVPRSILVGVETLMLSVLAGRRTCVTTRKLDRTHPVHTLITAGPAELLDSARSLLEATNSTDCSRDYNISTVNAGDFLSQYL